MSWTDEYLSTIELVLVPTSYHCLYLLVNVSKSKKNWEHKGKGLLGLIALMRIKST